MDEQLQMHQQQQIHVEDQEHQQVHRNLDDSYDDGVEDTGLDAYMDNKTTTLPLYLDQGGAGVTTTVVHDKNESYTMHSLKEQLSVLNTKAGIGSTNPIETAAVNTYRNGKFLLTGVLYNLTHIFSWTKRQRQRKKAVAKSMGKAFLKFGKNLLKTVGGVAASPFLTVYSVAKYVKNKYIDKEECLKSESLTHELCKKFYGYLWGGVVRNTLNTVLMGATLPLWLVGGTIKTLWKAVRHGEFKGFRQAFDLPTPMPPKEWEDYYDKFSLGGGVTKALENEKDSDTGKYKTRTMSTSWGDFCFRMKTHFTRFRDANWHSFFTGDMRNYSKSKVGEVVDYNNMQQI